MPINRPELFLIPSETIAAISREEVEASHNDMVELDIARLPYPKTDIGVSASDWLYSSSTGELIDGEMLFQYEDEKLTDMLIKRADGKFISWLDRLYDNYDRVGQESFDYLQQAGENCRQALIVLLATKNVVKTRFENKLARFGIGKNKKHNHLYTTTITIPPVETLTVVTAPTGVTLRPHLRRGHIRRQHYGPKNAFIKLVWLQPCFINADPDFISSRTAYNTSVTFPLERRTLH